MARTTYLGRITELQQVTGDIRTPRKEFPGGSRGCKEHPSSSSPRVSCLLPVCDLPFPSGRSSAKEGTDEKEKRSPAGGRATDRQGWGRPCGPDDGLDPSVFGDHAFSGSMSMCPLWGEIQYCP